MTPNQLNSLDFSQNLILNLIDKPDKESAIYNLTGNYGTLSYLTDLISGGKSVQVNGLGGKHEIPLMGDSTVIAQIASFTAGTGVITLTDPNYDITLFRDNDIVLDVNRRRGRVVAGSQQVIAGVPQFTVSLVPGQSAFAATDFVAGGWVKSGWDATNNYSVSGKSPIYQAPVYDYNYTAVSRGTSSFSRRDMFNTWVTTTSGGFWYSMTDELALMDFARARERKFWLSERGSSGANGYNQNGGLLWAIQDPIRGGVVRTLFNNPTVADINEFALAVGRRQATSTSTQTWLLGQGALANIQLNYTAPYVQHAGINNTFGGKEVKGINVMMFAIAGITVRCVLVPFFNDFHFFPETSSIPGVTGLRMSNTIVAIDEGMYSTFGNGMQPAMKKIHWGAEETIYGYISGLIGKDGVAASSTTKSGLIANAGDTVSFQLYEDNGIDCVAYNMGLLQLGA